MAFYIFAVDEDEQGKVNQAIKKIREKFPARCITADFSGTPFTRRRYEKFIQNKAREFYFKDVSNQAGQIKLAKKSASDLVAEWIRQLAVATVRVWSSAEESAQVSGAGNFFRLLRELNKKFFGVDLEEISINDNLFQPQKLTETVAKYALRDERISGSFAFLNSIGKPFRELVVRDGENFWETTPSHPISKMKLVVDSVIEDSLAQRNEVAFSDIWLALKKPPVGLLKCPGSVFLFALLMKNYADKNFYVRDINGTTSTLTDEKLCTLIATAVKELPGAQGKFIVKQTPEHKKFCLIIISIHRTRKRICDS